jgi:polar amino acid transport system permease protein
MSYQLDFSFLEDRWPDLLRGVLLTAELTTIAIVLGSFFGTLCAVGAVSRFSFLRRMIAAYVEIIRNTPLIVQTFWLFFGLSILGARLSPIEAAATALTVNVTAYTSEIIRAGIASIHRGQIEAAQSLGLNSFQLFRDVVLPPAIEKVFPALTSQFVLMMLASSIMSQISTEELTAVAGRIQSETFRGIETYLVVAVIYVLLSLLLRFIFQGVAHFVFPRRRRMKLAQATL